MARAEADQGAAAASAAEVVYYRHEDASGKVTVVDSLEKLPAEVRAKAERVVLTGTPEVRVDPRGHAERATAAPLPFGVDTASFALGLGAGMLSAGLIGLMLSRLSGGAGRWVVRGALTVGLAVLIAGSYFGWVRRTAGIGNGTLASPGQLVQDARDAAERVRQLRDAQRRELDEIQRMAQ
ncbi:MAG: hypothetical protein JW940_21970 [Polyangiaceae bacterium]|nr:hypothetical protein [Polyangiaceae bacterium]